MSLVEVKTAEASFKDSILQLQEIFTHFDKLGSEGVSGALTTEKLGEALRAATGVSFPESALRDMVSAVDLNDSGDVQFSEFLKMMDAARNDPAIQHVERVTVHDLQEGLGALGIEAAAAPLKNDRSNSDADQDAGAAGGDEEHKQADAAVDGGDVVDSRLALLASARLHAEAEYVMSREDVRAVFQSFDSDGDGRISAEELQALLQKFGEKYAEEEVHAMIHLVDGSNSGFISYQAFLRLMSSAAADD
jgi:Ca2+-binding EF-hand superfamily protein